MTSDESDVKEEVGYWITGLNPTLAAFLFPSFSFPVLSPPFRSRTPLAYRTRPHRRHGSASEDQVASVANKQIYLFWLSESFQIPFEDVDWSRRHCFIIKIVPIIDNSLWDKVVSQVSRRSLFHKLQWVTSCCSIAAEFKERVKWDWWYSMYDLIDFD